MANSSREKNILFIVEGNRAEPQLLRRINNVIGFKEFNIVSYNTSIYELYDVCMELIHDEDLDFLLVLKEKTKDEKDRNILSRKFASIFLVFDFDPHHQKYGKEKIKTMSRFFCDSTDNGQLLLSFPMIEATRHLSMMPDHPFLDRTASKEDIKTYKYRVSEISAYRDIQKYNYPVVSEMIAHHLIKFKYLIDQTTTMPTRTMYEQLMTEGYESLIEIQDQAYDDDKLNVMSMALFFVIDLKPITFFKTRLCQYRLNL